MTEGGVGFEVTIGVGHKTGLYLDQRDNRSRVEALAQGRDVLDAFSYTAGFACHALRGGALRAVCIESSPETIAGARQNLALNGFEAQAEIRAENAFDELRRLERGGSLLTFSCSHHVSEALFEEICRDAAADAGVRLRVVDRLGQSSDHPVLLSVPETRYLKGLLLEAT